MKRRNASHIVRKVLMCEGCGVKRIVPRRMARNKGAGHRKPMFCTHCCRVTYFYEITEA